MKTNQSLNLRFELIIITLPLGLEERSTICHQWEFGVKVILKNLLGDYANMANLIFRCLVCPKEMKLVYEFQMFLVHHSSIKILAKI